MNSTFRDQSSSQNLPDAAKKELTPMATHAYTTDTVSPTSSSYQATSLIVAQSSHDHSNSIISRETLDRVELQTLTPAEKNMAMFDAIEAWIKTNPSSFVSLLGILNSDSQLQIFAGHLQQCYGKCYSPGIH